ncbi:MAG: hypothetical protein QNJ15_13995 [Erythrobacter sp.]|nr:hypothetical protein [Erythrobacter sp.]
MSISDAQWLSINLNLLGLRSGETADDLDGASYAMNCNADRMARKRPEEWDDLLEGTVRTMHGFENRAGRFLQIVRPSHGKGQEYQGCFPKCSAKPNAVLAAVQFGDQSVADLVAWVEENIPDTVDVD